MMGPAIDVTVNRNYIYQDAFDQLTEDKGKTKKVTDQFFFFSKIQEKQGLRPSRHAKSAPLRQQSLLRIKTTRHFFCSMSAV